MLRTQRIGRRVHPSTSPSLRRVNGGSCSATALPFHFPQRDEDPAPAPGADLVASSGKRHGPLEAAVRYLETWTVAFWHGGRMSRSPATVERAGIETTSTPRDPRREARTMTRRLRLGRRGRRGAPRWASGTAVLRSGRSGAAACRRARGAREPSPTCRFRILDIHPPQRFRRSQETCPRAGSVVWSRR